MIFNLISALVSTATDTTAENPEIMSDIQLETLISDLAFILILGAVVTVLFKWLKQPVVLGYIVAGFLASPHFEYLPSVTTESNIEFWAQLGIVVLLFSLGLEFSFKKLLNTGGSAVVTALIIVIGMMAAGFGIGHVLNFSNMNSLFLGGMLSMSSTTIIIKAFTDLNLRQKKFASLVFAVLIVEDLFAVLMMVILSSIAVNNSVEGGEMLFSVSKLVFFLVIWFLVGVYLLPTLLNAIRRYLNNETLLVVSLGLCFGMAVFSVYCGFSLALGAFVMGSIIAGISYAERIEQVITPVKDLFGAVFFISVGMMVDLHVIEEYISPILILSCVVIVGMIVFGTFGMLITGQPLRIAMESGFSLTQIGEFAFIIASLGMSLGVLNPIIYPIVVAVSVITTFTTPYFIRLADPAYNFVEKHLPRKLHFLINRYTTNATSECETRVLWKTVLKRYLWRILLYSSVIIAIILITLRYLLPWLETIIPSWSRLIA
ncbi:cation:proton antiporter, partial [uncultured Muribaculum sp.]